MQNSQVNNLKFVVSSLNEKPADVSQLGPASILNGGLCQTIEALYAKQQRNTVDRGHDNPKGSSTLKPEDLQQLYEIRVPPVY